MEGGRGGWNKDVLSEKNRKINNRVGGGAGIIRDSRVDILQTLERCRVPACHNEPRLSYFFDYTLYL